ncbi:MAG: hypothetical protein HYX67_13340 [Candidatus Melainabacteria bacterium]|nr:hypothetical protein [Candidatus Melainabacteria bacterium]
MKSQLLMIAFYISISCTPSLSQAPSATAAADPMPSLNQTAATKTGQEPALGVKPAGSAQIAAPAIAIPTPVIKEPPKRHGIRIGLPGLFHINMP